MLTTSQEEIKNNIIKAVESGQKRIILKGSAGVGKTFLTKSIVEHFLAKKRRWEESYVWVTAPTNKALSILQKKIGVHKGLKFATVHSALKLKKYVNPKSGIVSFKPDKSSRDPAFMGATLAIVDECSMLNSEVIKNLDAFNFPIIFCGDDKQLNPVGELETPIFNKGYPEFELTEIIRQGAGNPIIALSRNLGLIHQKNADILEGKGFLYNSDKQEIISNLAEINGTDDLKYLAWTNREVDIMNHLVRKKIYGHPAKIEVNESLIFKEPYGSYWTNQEITVKSLEILSYDFYYPGPLTTFSKKGWCNPDYVPLKVYKINSDIFVIHEDSEEALEKFKKEILFKCRTENYDWRGYFWFLEQFASLTYNHAISVHKSQGSTYKEVIVNIGNLMLNKNDSERERLLYTAVTRASDLLILANVR